MHQKEVCRICFRTNLLRYTGCHRNGRYSGRTNQRIYFTLCHFAHQFTKENAGCCTDSKCHQTKYNNLQCLWFDKLCTACLCAYRCTKKDNYDIHHCIGCCFHQLWNHSGFTEEVTKHQHTYERCCTWKDQTYHSRNNDWEKDSFQFGNRTKLFHLDLSFLLCCKEFHDRWLDDRHQ